MNCSEDVNLPERIQGSGPQFHIGIKLTLQGYIPSNRNQLKGSHWSAEFHEKKRAALALRSCLQSMPFAPVIGTDGTLNPYLIWSSTLESYLETHGISLKGVSVRDVFRRRKKKELKLRSLG